MSGHGREEMGKNAPAPEQGSFFHDKGIGQAINIDDLIYTIFSVLGQARPTLRLLMFFMVPGVNLMLNNIV